MKRDSDEIPKNVLGGPLQLCSDRPLTGFYRDGCCKTGGDDLGAHVACVRVTKAFLEFSLARGNDLTTPHPEFGFPGLKPGDQWCLCAARWVEALNAGAAPRLVLTATHEFMLEFTSLAELKKYAIDLN
jgi:uncharacterized protein